MSKKLASIALAAVAVLSLSSCMETEPDWRDLEAENERLRYELDRADCEQRNAARQAERERERERKIEEAQRRYDDDPSAFNRGYLDAARAAPLRQDLYGGYGGSC